MIRKCGLDLNMTQFLRPFCKEQLIASLKEDAESCEQAESDGRTDLDINIRLCFGLLKYLQLFAKLNALVWYMRWKQECRSLHAVFTPATSDFGEIVLLLLASLGF